MHRFLHHVHHAHHHIWHWAELLLIMAIFTVNFITAGFTPGSDELITDHTIVAQNLIDAQTKWWPVGSNIISMRAMDGSVENTFYPGYCTYGAARISPEFFPYIDSKTQSRTRWGNATDRCNNAQATGFKVSTTPAQWTLIVYSKIWSSTFGHVGKVMYHNNSKKSMIVRDMNRVGKFIMTDRREETDDVNIKCYIYPNRTTSTTTTITIPTIMDTWTIVPPTIIIPPTNPTTINTGTNIITTNTGATTTTDSGTINPPIILPPIQTNARELELNFDNVSDLAKHFLTQREIKVTISASIPLDKGGGQGPGDLKIWDKATLTISVRNRNTQASYEWLLDVPFDTITTNGNVSSNYSTIKFLKNWEEKIILKALQIGETTVILNFWWEKIGKINFTVQ